MRGKLLGGRYRIQTRIGEGGMAYVYLARDEKLTRKVAIKILHRHMAENPDIRSRFFQEAHAMSALDHPNILKIYDFSGESSEDLWMVMEVLKGLNLSDYVRTFPGNWVHPIIASMIACEVLKALQSTHQQALVHRDVKPENVFVLNNGSIKLMDFGIVKDARSNSMTVTGTFMGSPSYMSPEQVRGRSIDNRSDVYSLGVLLYEIVTGKLPFSGSSTHDVILKITEGKFNEPKVHVPNLPADLNKIICKAMAKHPVHRYQEARTFLRDLQIFLGKHNFEESHIELERYFAERDKFEKRLRKLSFSNKATIHIADAKKIESNGRSPTTRTRLLTNDEREQAFAQNKNQKGLEAPIKPPAKPIVHKPADIKPPRRDHQIPKSRHPQFSRQPQAFTAHKQPFAPTMLPPPPASTYQAIQRPGQLKKRRVKPRVPKRRPKARVIYQKSAYTPSVPVWISSFIGVFLVAIIGLGTVWGFMKIAERIPSKTSPQPQVPTQKKPEAVAPIKKHATRKPKKVAQPNKPIEKSQPAPLPANTKRDSNKNRPTKPSQFTRRLPTQPRPVPKEPVAAPPVTTPDKKTPPTLPGRLLISSTPAAEIFIDQKKSGTTVDRTLHSNWISLSPGSHKIVLKRRGYKPYSTQIEIKNGEAKKLPKIVLQPDTSYLLVLAAAQSPVRVIVTSQTDNQRRSFTLRGDEKVQVLPSGRYNIQFIYQGKNIERQITLEGEDSKRNLRVDFSGGSAP